MKSTFSLLNKAIFCLVFLTAAATSACAQDTQRLPDDFDELIALKTELLQQFSEIQKTGPPEKALQTLRTIINIHRKALKLGLENKLNDELIGKLQQVYGDDTSYLSDQLFDRGGYTESAALRKEVEQFYRKLLGPQHGATIAMHWKAITAEKLSAAPKAKQAAYVVATGSEARAQQAMQNGQLEVAAQIYAQLVDAEAAVLDEAHPDVAVDLNELGRVLWMQEKYDDAEKIYQRSLKAREATTGKDLQFATTLFNLGRVYQDTNRMAEAEQQYLAVAAIEEPILGSTNESFLQTLQQLATVYEQTGDAEKLADIQRRIGAADPLATVMTHLPGGTYAAAALQPSLLAGDPQLQLLPFEIIEATGMNELGFNPLDLEAVVAFATLPIGEPPFHFGVLFKLKDGVQVQYPWVREMQPVQFGEGQQYLKEENGGGAGLCFVEFQDDVALLGTEETIRQSLTRAGDTQVGNMILADREQGQLIAAVNMEQIRPIVQMGLQETPPLPPQLEGLKSIPVDTNTVQFWLNMSESLKLTLILNSADGETATRTSQAIAQGLDFGLQMAMQELDSEIPGEDAVQLATRAYAHRMATRYLNRLKPSVTNNSVVVQLDALEDSFGPVAVAMLLPAVRAARGAAQRTQDMNSLKQIGLAMHIYHDTHSMFPTRANYDKAGKPLLSWRVHLLPYLEQQELYSQFKLDEPWDSEHNMKLAQQLPEVYRNRNFDDETKTVYVTLDGQGTFMEGTKGLKFRDMTDGTSNTLMVVEANPENAVIWTKPEDLPFDEQDPGNGLGAIRPEGFQAAYTDGSVRLIPADLEDETLRRLSLRNDGQVVEDF